MTIAAFGGGVVLGFLFGFFLTAIKAATLPPPPKAREPIPRKRPDNCTEFYRRRNVA